MAPLYWGVVRAPCYIRVEYTGMHQDAIVNGPACYIHGFLPGVYICASIMMYGGPQCAEKSEFPMFPNPCSKIAIYPTII